MNRPAPWLRRAIEPHRICHLIGHKRTGYDPDGHPGNYRPRRRNRWYMRCDRCGTTDGGEVYRKGLLERFQPWRLRVAWYGVTSRIRQWRETACMCCGLPIKRFGRPVGDHEKCDDIPF